MSASSIPFEKALPMAQKYCAYQDRCSSQVLAWCRQKQLVSADVQRLMAELKQNGYLDDERFARAYARGKFRNNHWGMVKIAAGLKARGICQELIEEALSEIDVSDYLMKLESLLIKKIGFPLVTLTYQDQMRIASWAAAKGYERPLIMDVLKQVAKEDNNECE
jgi:regulatory protein